MVLEILCIAPSNLFEPQKKCKQISEKLIISQIVKTLVFSKVQEDVLSLSLSIQMKLAHIDTHFDKTNIKAFNYTFRDDLSNLKWFD